MTNVNEILEQAFTAASEAADGMIADNPETWFPCGFAWVKITPARGPFVKALKEMGAGRTSYEGGFQVWNPSGNTTRWMDAKYAGAKAFADVLKRHGVNCYAASRMD